ncbi:MULTISPECIES: molybdate ABC transporter substrate-binding protein [unclassified Crossiella]|uniref:molybdate ABC transporter substrate-binding protein n=1 Tax=unclassified Crossiella TaxID=2620835 RepID=UPI001FFEF895|nr:MULTISPECIES: molybdate ABC transporter substrate-binding protein [unclassified Crossiella]MCK2241543.1 molybdate ABC transporter substrate-binding protein [Crossiella sp. S99.2]MCK2255585.1 molybdate ABC transporter substrate-binding protein [Crossiella sp. S99.1]
MRRVVPLVALLVLAGCGSAPAPPAGAGGAVTVFAAASLTESFTRIGKDFEAANPGVKVTFNFGASSALAQQLNQGAPADVFASAAPANMKQVTDTKTVTETPVTFARNRLQIAVPKGNPAKVTGLADFGRAELKIALCAEQVPCGAGAKKVLQAAKVTGQPDTLEQDVKAVLTKVRLGEVDAALVYRTDVRSAGAEVDGITFAEADQAINDYPLAALATAPNASGAKAFLDYVRSDKGRAVLAEAGFDGP